MTVNEIFYVDFVCIFILAAMKLEDTLWGAYNIYVLVKSSSHHKALSVQVYDMHNEYE